MEINREQADHLVQQLQHAHRINVAFYQRILPSLDEIANQLDCEFWYWQPIHTDLPARSSTRPSSKWAWDFQPLFASEHNYLHASGDTVDVGDFALTFQLYIDKNFEKDQLKKIGVKGQPNPVDLPIGEAVLRVFILKIVQPSNDSFESLWNEADFPAETTDSYVMVGKNMQGCCLVFKLSEVLRGIEPIIQKLIGLVNLSD